MGKRRSISCRDRKKGEVVSALTLLPIRAIRNIRKKENTEKQQRRPRPTEYI